MRCARKLEFGDEVHRRYLLFDLVLCASGAGRFSGFISQRKAKGWNMQVSQAIWLGSNPMEEAGGEVDDKERASVDGTGIGPTAKPNLAVT